MVAVTIGTGTFTYDIVDDWAKLPQGWALGQAEPAVDRDDRVYVFNRSEHPLVVLDREGNFITEWGQGVLTDAHGIFISGDDYIYLPVREAHAVVKYTLDGRPMFTMGLWDKPSDTGGYGPTAPCSGPLAPSTGAPTSGCPPPGTCTYPTVTPTAGCTSIPPRATTFSPGAARASRPQESSISPTASGFTGMAG